MSPVFPVLWDLRLLLGVRFREARHRLAGLRRQSRLKVTVVTLFGGVLVWGLYAMFRQAFRFLSRFPEVEDRILPIGFGLFFFALGVMLVVSSAVIAYGVFFRGRESAYLLTSPARAEHVFSAQFLEVLIYASWAFVFLAVPLLAGYAQVYKLSATAVIVLVVLVAFFSVIPSALGCLGAQALALLGPRRLNPRLFAILGAGAAAAVLILGRSELSWRRAHGQMDAAWLFGLLDRLSFLDSPLLPSQWLSAGLFATSRGDWAGAAYQGLSLVTTGAFLFTLGYLVALRFQRQAAARVHADGGGRPGRAGTAWGRLAEGLLGVLFPRRAALLILKDLKTFLRDVSQWSQVLVFFGLLGIYFLNLRELAYPIGEYYWKNLIAFLNLSATCLTLGTFTGRFVFPLVSLEGRRFWVLGLMPMPRGTVLWSKFWFSFLGGVMLSGSLIALSDTMLSVPLPMALIHAFSVLVICAGLSGMAVGLGAAFPDLKEESPAKIVSGFGGTLNLVLSLAFMAAVVLLEAIPCHLYYARELMGWPDFQRVILWCSLGVLGLGIAAVWIPMTLGERAFRRLDL